MEVAMSKYKSRKRKNKSSFQDVLPTPLLLVLAGIVY
jgi:hypothetical protein